MWRDRAVLGDGLILGVLGYLVLVLSFMILNIVAGRDPLATAIGVGAALFYRGVVPANTTLALIAGSALHLLAFILLGVIVSVGASVAARMRRGWYPLLVALAFVFLHLIGAALALNVERTVLPLSAMLIAGCAATAAMAAYVLATRPDLIDRAGEAQRAVSRE